MSDCLTPLKAFLVFHLDSLPVSDSEMTWFAF